jgi:dipicolinate synthase subunit A
MLKIAVIGGDERARRLASICGEKDLVTTLGLNDGDEACTGLEEADILLFPYPYSAQNGRIPNARGLCVDPPDVLSRAKNGAVALAGEGLEPYVAAAEAMGKAITLKRYRDDEVFLQENADISAEGALCYAMQQLDVCMAGLSVLVIGYGRFGRALAQKLRNLDANVIVAARSDAARLKARSDGMHAVDLPEIPQAAGGIRVLMNTVPARVVEEKALEMLPPNALLLELAGRPYGFDLKMAESMGFSAVKLPGIPARYAPESAAKALYEAMNRMLMGGKKE